MSKSGTVIEPLDGTVWQVTGGGTDWMNMDWIIK